jgi:hypothetical protein
MKRANTMLSGQQHSQQAAERSFLRSAAMFIPVQLKQLAYVCPAVLFEEFSRVLPRVLPLAFPGIFPDVLSWALPGLLLRIVPDRLLFASAPVLLSVLPEKEAERIFFQTGTVLSSFLTAGTIAGIITS